MADTANVLNEVERTFSFVGKTVVIIGAGSGLGQEAARLFALAGASLVLADIDDDGLKATASLLAGTGSRFICRRADVARRDDMEDLASFTASEIGAPDVWINGAGISFLHPLMETDPDKAARVIAINMMGPYWGSVAAARVMKEKGGSIINLSSGGGAKPLPGIAIYGMTKAAVNSLTWTSAAEFGAFGIRVNAIAPGWIETPMSRELFKDEKGQYSSELQERVRRQMAEKSPLGILGQPSDIGYALLYLASDASRFVTGQILAVNGGESM